MIYSNRKEQNKDTCYNTEEPQKYGKWKKADTKDYMFYGSIYMKCPEKAKL